MNTLRSDCERGRITYRPDWDEESPWISYVRGVAKRHHKTLRAGISYLETHWDYRFKKWNIT